MEDTITNKWSTRISLTGVLASLLKSCTDHAITNLGDTVGFTASLICYNGD